MKFLNVAFVSLLFLLPSQAFAGGQICSNESVHFVNVRKDFGTPPPPGISTGRRMLAIEGEVLYDFGGEGGVFEPLPYQVRTNLIQALYSEGNEWLGETVAKMALTVTDAQGQVIASERVVCRTFWARLL